MCWQLNSVGVRYFRGILEAARFAFLEGQGDLVNGLIRETSRVAIWSILIGVTNLPTKSS